MGIATRADYDLAALGRMFVESLGRLGDGLTASMFTPDAVFRCRMRSDSLPLKKEMSGREFCEELKPQMKTLFPDGVRHDVQSVLVCGDKVVVESECHAVSTSNRIYNNYFVFILTFTDGLVSEVREYADFLHVSEVVFAQ